MIWIALLRGINVGGNNILPMKELTHAMTQAGFEDVKTYIQSGNVVFKSKMKSASKIAEKLGHVIEDAKGFRPQIMVLSGEGLSAALKANPYSQAEEEPKTLHFYFMSGKIKNVDFTPLEDLKKPNEAFSLKGDVFYLYAPDGIGRSKMADRVEKTLGVGVTARNLRTVMKIMEMVQNTA